MKWISLFLMIMLMNNSHCKREKRGITDFFIPGINIGDIALDQIKILIYGKPIDKDQLIIDRQLDHIKTTDEILRITREISSAVDKVPDLAAIVQVLQKMPTHLNKIDDAFRQYEHYERRNTSNYRVLEYSKNSINRYTGPLNEVLELYSIVVPPSADQRVLKDKEYSLLSLITTYMKDFKKLCDDFKSEQLMLYTIMESITVSELKVLLIMEFSVRKLATIEDVDYDEELDIIKEGIRIRFQKLTSRFQVHMKNASRDVWRCDPKSYEEGKNFFRLNNFQKYIARGKELTGHHNCRQRCSGYNDVTHDKCIGYKQVLRVLHKIKPKPLPLPLFPLPALFVSSKHLAPVSYGDYDNTCNSIRKCAGKLYSCESFFGMDTAIWTCPAESGSPHRYKFFREGDYEKRNYRQFGSQNYTQSTCPTGYIFDMTYSDYSGKNPTCEMCACTCDDTSASYADKKINLRVATADKDHVVTGIRWLKKEKTLHIQIQQGKILSRGKVDISTIKWKNVQEPRNNLDLATISWANLRGFHLKDIELQDIKGSVVAGVKLEVVQSKSRKLISLRLLPVTYNYQSGKLKYSKPFYEDPDSSLSQGLWDEPPKVVTDSEYKFKGTKLSTEAKNPSLPVDNAYNYVLLTTSDFYTDAGKNTVPLFDMQDNELSTPAPLSGLGIYLKTSDDYSGFIALKLITFDYAPHVMEKISNTTTTH